MSIDQDDSDKDTGYLMTIGQDILTTASDAATDSLTPQHTSYKHSTKLVQGEVVNVICSKKQNSLVLLRHKEQADSQKSTLTIFYFQDSIED